jgi:hypothetical protein
MKSHAAICGLSFAFCFCNLLARVYKVSLDTSSLGLCWHNKMLLPAKLPQCPISQLEIPATLPPTHIWSLSSYQSLGFTFPNVFACSFPLLCGAAGPLFPSVAQHGPWLPSVMWHGPSILLQHGMAPGSWLALSAQVVLCL